MSGYLQRLVRGAITPVESIHPMVGSVYSPLKYGDHGPDRSNFEAFLSEPEEGAAIPRSRFTAKHDPSSGTEATRTDREAAPVSEIFAEQQEHALALLKYGDHGPDRSNFEAFLSEPEEGAAIPRSRFTAKHDPSSGTEATRTDREAAPVSEIFAERQEHALALQLVPVPSSREQEHSVPIIPAYQPVMSRDPADARFTNSAKPGDQTILFPAAVTQSKRSDFLRAAAVERDRDEIQIHIGRIEVTALPATPMRPAPQPARKGLNLEEYLKRSDRRAR